MRSCLRFSPSSVRRLLALAAALAILSCGGATAEVGGSRDGSADAALSSDAPPEIDVASSSDARASGDSPTTTACDSGNCFCGALSACTRGVGQVQQLPLGSQGWRICGHDEGPACVVNVFRETEGGLSLWRCFAPDTFACGAGTVPGPESLTCEHLLDCNLLIGNCPADVLACSPSTPTCDQADPKSFGPELNFLGYAFDGTGCVPVSGDCDDRCGAIFPTRDACWKGCSRSCTDVTIERAMFHERNVSCTTAADCRYAAAAGPPYDHCSCTVLLNGAADLGRWQALNFSYGCFQEGPCCDAVPGRAACVDGRCASIRPPAASDAATDTDARTSSADAGGTDGGFTCNQARCRADQYCCNDACSICADRGQLCAQGACTNDSSPTDAGRQGGCIARGTSICPAGQTYYTCGPFSFMPRETCTEGAVGNAFTDYCCR